MKICIVDDDQYIIDKIVQGIDWQEIGIDIVLTANNIRQAMKILETKTIDILISDIEMPQGSGLELLEWIRAEKIKVECIYVSSYAHFAYAQKALQLNCSEYLLKPVSNIELKKTINSVMKKISLNNTKKTSDINENWKNMLFKQDFSEIDELWKKDKKGIIGYIQWRPHEEIGKKIYQESFVIEEKIRAQFENSVLLISISQGLYFIQTFEYSLVELKDMWSNNYEQLRHMYKGEFFLYVSREIYGQNFTSEYNALKTMLQEGVFGEEYILTLEQWDVKVVKNRQPHFDIWESELLIRENFKEIENKNIEFLKEQWENKRINQSFLRQFREGFMQMIYRLLSQKKLRLSQLFNSLEFEEYYERSVYSLNSSFVFIRIVMQRLESVLKNEKNETDVVERIKIYIEENLSTDLSRNVLADYVNISEDYLTKKFILKTGMSIPNYITMIRMKKAKEYFETSELNVSEVATLVGYNNFSYFSKSFRDYVGCTPNSYRKQN